MCVIFFIQGDQRFLEQTLTWCWDCCDNFAYFHCFFLGLSQELPIYVHRLYIYIYIYICICVFWIFQWIDTKFIMLAASGLITIKNYSHYQDKNRSNKKLNRIVRQFYLFYDTDAAAANMQFQLALWHRRRTLWSTFFFYINHDAPGSSCIV